ncbi:hypothetical protein BFN67_23320 [Pseudaminobacter manganicus]|uniref:Uncharacterized protein n=1 Tax=Manganibacter manganicus TaxID=1873176 RepID=A0A1V8RL01_9HYPH|nr:hypothetical protein BFN67_23320 [Pseudaminobacter manganicus]
MRAISAASATTALFGCIRALQPIKPASKAIPGSIQVSEAGPRAMNEELADIAVPALADAEELLLAPG